MPDHRSRDVEDERGLIDVHRHGEQFGAFFLIAKEHVQHERRRQLRLALSRRQEHERGPDRAIAVRVEGAEQRADDRRLPRAQPERLARRGALTVGQR